MTETPDPDAYALRGDASREIPAPDLDYAPPIPRSYHPKIALIGAGGIAAAHLDAYRAAGWQVAAICSRTLARARARADEFFPQAQVTDDWRAVLARDDIEVVDITPHPGDRLPIVEAALEAGKHVLSQKPFALDLETGSRLVELADVRGVKLAVNQNGRWAPHLAWMRAAVHKGLVGEIVDATIAIHWDHGWIAGTPFEDDPNLILFDFGVHWFDFLASIAGDRLQSVRASTTAALGQKARVPLLGQALVRMEGGQAALCFAGANVHGPRDTSFIAGTEGSLVSTGPNLGDQQVTLTTARGHSRPKLHGTWFNDGFRGAMGELLCAIEDDREPENGARGNLRTLALTFAAVAASQSGEDVAIGSVTRLPAAAPASS